MHDGSNPRRASFAPFGAREDETLPEIGPERRETTRLGRGLVVAQLLVDVRRKLEGYPDGKARRALMRKLESLQFVVDWWDAMPPRPEQVSAMLEMLLRLQEAADDGRSFWTK